MKELKGFIVTLIIVGIMATALLAFMSPFINNYGVQEPGDLSVYNELEMMTNTTSEAEDNLKGIDSETSGTELAGIITKSAYSTVVDGLRSIPVMGKMFVYAADDLGIPSSILMGVLSIIIIGIVFGLALLFLQVISR